LTLAQLFAQLERMPGREHDTPQGRSFDVRQLVSGRYIYSRPP
jgi:hypothetical protein